MDSRPMRLCTTWVDSGRLCRPFRPIYPILPTTGHCWSLHSGQMPHRRSSMRAVLYRGQLSLHAKSDVRILTQGWSIVPMFLRSCTKFRLSLSESN